MKIVHITTHMGGGAGKAIAGLISHCAEQESIEQKLLVLEAPEKSKYIQSLGQDKLEIIIGRGFDLDILADWADVIVISWWDHPLMSGLFMDISKIRCRLALWTHINGCSYPYLPFGFADVPERLFVTTRFTLDNPLWSMGEREEIRKKSRLISGVGDFRPKDIVPKRDYEAGGKFIVGYVGTLNYAKLHKDYLAYCRAAINRIPDIHFLIVGDREEDLRNEVREMGLAEYFSFTGYVDDVYGQYHRMDVMGYLLNEDNYGTTENVILEAMAVGLPVITCKNAPESYILQDDLNGYLIKGPEEYAERLDRLYHSKELRQRIGTSARDHVIKNYSIADTTEKFLGGLRDIMLLPPKEHDFAHVMGTTVFEWFKAFTGPDKPFFDMIREKSAAEIRSFLKDCLPIYKERTKSSFRHFLYYYECEELQSLLKEME
ncbi:MAG: glycosyltransferase family 4 protein [Lachnospiraceae bacterium]|nr:glycosyltransferase family 4 protein [Butyrivibrio sp.]MCM1410277.1 glycosyltransferase family 4 protein [Lachnospiraceae bacterium]